MDLVNGSAELFHLLLFSWDVRDECVLIESNRLQMTKKTIVAQGVLLGPVSLEELMALGIGMAAYIVSYETRSRKPALTASHLPVVVDFLFEVEMSMVLRSKTYLQDLVFFFLMVGPNIMYLVSKLVGSCCNFGAIVLASDLAKLY